MDTASDPEDTDESAPDVADVSTIDVEEDPEPDADPGYVPTGPPGSLGSPCSSPGDCLQDFQQFCVHGICLTMCKNSGFEIPGACDTVAADTALKMEWACPGDEIFCLPGIEKGEFVRCDGTPDCAAEDAVCGFPVPNFTTDEVGGYCLPGGGRTKIGEPCAEHTDCESIQCMNGLCTELCRSADCDPAYLCVGSNIVGKNQTFPGGACVPHQGSLQACGDEPCPAGEYCSVYLTPPDLPGPLGTLCMIPYPGEAALGEPCVDIADCESGLCRAVAPGKMACGNACEADAHCPDDHHCVEVTGAFPYYAKYQVCVVGAPGDYCEPESTTWCQEGSVCAAKFADSVCCMPDCGGKACGFDGCGQSCGQCDDGIACTVDDCSDCETCAYSADDSLCDDGDPCTIDACDADQGCVLTGESPCNEPDKSICTADGDVAVCECDEGFGDDEGTCKSLTPCTPNPCTVANQTVCVPDGFDSSCACDDGFGDDGGVCKTLTPCADNPCTEPNKSTCTADGFDYTCTCTDPDAVGEQCLPPCPGQHFDGDVYEPNDCQEHATPVDDVEAASSKTFTLSIGPQASDVDWFAVGVPAGTAYWMLQNLDDDVSCTPGQAMPTPSGGYERAVSFDAFESDTVTCQEKAGVVADYKLKVIAFDTSGPDGSNSVTSPTELGAVNNVSDSISATFDKDCNRSTFSLPSYIATKGQAVDIYITLEDMFFTTGLDCPESTSLKTCGTLTGTGEVTGTFCFGSSINFDSSAPAYTASW